MDYKLKKCPIRFRWTILAIDLLLKFELVNDRI